MAWPVIQYTPTDSKVQGHLSGIDDALGNALDVTSLRTLSGTAAGATNYGTVFTGATIPNNATVAGALQALETAVEAFTGTTNLATANVGATTLDVTSSSGTDVTLPAATNAAAGVMPAADKAKVDLVTITQAVDLDAMETQQGNFVTLSGLAANATDLGVFTGTTITDSAATVKSALQELETALEAVPSRVQTVVANVAARDALAGSVVGDLAWVADASADATVTAGGAMYIWDGGAWVKVAEAESLDVVTNLAYTAAAAQGTVTSSSGTDAILPAGSTTNASLMLPADKVKSDFISVTQAVDLDAIETTQGTINTQQGNLITLTGQAANATTFGTGFTGTTIPDNSDLTAALQALETAVEANTGATNLAYTAAVAQGTVTSDTGTDAIIPAGSTVNASLMLPADKVKTDFITVTQAVDLDAMETDIAEHQTLFGVADGSTTFGTTFTGTTIADNRNITQALQDLETALEAVPTKRQSVVPDITARNAIGGSQAGDVAYVQDASADATVAAGAAMYIWDGAAWQKVSEFESLDVQTNLGTANITTTNLDVTSSSGTDVTLPSATNAAAGVMTGPLVADIEDLITFTGVAGNSANLGATITGDIVQANRTVAQAIQDLVNYFTPTSATSAQLNAIGDAINTTGKHLGRPVYNTTLNLFVWSQGPAAADAWIDGAGLEQNTPV